MSRGFPSMTALLGILAVAGYENQTKSLRCSGAQLKKRKLPLRANWEAYWASSARR